MIITVASYKGGVAKTTTAIHLATSFSEEAPTPLIDGDANRSALGWAQRGSLPFKVIDERQAAKFSRQYEHVVIDTQARPTEEDLQALIDGCDLLVIPSTPDALALDALMQTLSTLRTLAATAYRVLLTIVPPAPNHDGDEARRTLDELQVPLFAGYIRRLIAFQKAALAGIPVSQVEDPRAQNAWEDYRTVAAEILPVPAKIEIPFGTLKAFSAKAGVI
jgi:chromosome partitioning protein